MLRGGILVLSFLVALTGSAKNLKVAVISDLNGNYGDTAYDREVTQSVQRIIAMKPDLVLSTGDMIASQKKTLKDSQVSKMWQAFDRLVAKPLRTAGIPLAPTPGNHDASGYAGYERDRKAYSTFWKNKFPKTSTAFRYVKAMRAKEDSPFRYAFVFGGRALFVSLDSTKVEPLSAEQKAWLFEILDAHSSVPIKIVYGHVPLYPFATDGRERDYLKDPEFESELLKRGVSMFLSGHHHAYFPGRRGNLLLVGTSCLGGGQRRLLTSANFGEQKPSPKSMIWMELSENKIDWFEALKAPDFVFKSLIERRHLPEWVGWPEMRIDRDDAKQMPERKRRSL